MHKNILLSALNFDHAIAPEMHHCMSLPEIVARVATIIADDSYRYKTHSLLAMALTCHTFYIPARAALWRNIWSDNIEFLMTFFPKDVVWNSADNTEVRSNQFYVQVNII